MVSIGPRIKIDGETHFRQALQQIYHSVSNVKKEMDLTTASFKKNETELSKNKKTTEALGRVIEELTTKLQFQRSAYDQTFLQINEVQKKYLNLTNKTIPENIQKVKDAKQAWEDMAKAHGEESKQAKDAQDKYNSLNSALKNSEDRAKACIREVERLNTAQDDMRGRMYDTELEIKKYNEELQKVPNTLQTIGSELEKSGEKLSEWGNTLSTYVTAPLAALGTYSVKEAATFEDGMAKIYTIADQTEMSMEDMREALIQLSNDTGYSLEDLAEAEYQAVSASVKTGDAVEFLAQAAKLARGGFTTTTQSVDLLTTVINAYGMEAKDAARINDILLKTQNDGKTIIDELAQSMGTVIPTAANYNISLEQLAGAYATMTKQGVNTSRSTTFLNAMFTELEKESSDVSKILMNETGMSFAQLMDSGMSLADVLRILYDAVGNDNEQFQRLFGNIRSGKAAAALINNDFKTLTDEINAMYEATGQTDHALEVLQTPALKAKIALNQLKNSTVDIGATLINDFAPAFEKLIDYVEKGTDWFHNLDEGTKTLITRVGVFAAALGPVFKVLGSGITTIGKVVGGIGTLKKNILLTADALSFTHMGASNLLYGMVAYLPTIVGVGAAFAGVAVATEAMMEADREAINQKYGLNEEMQNSIDKLNEYNQTLETTRQSNEERIESIELQAETTKALVEEYNNLIGSNGEVMEGNEALADQIINELAETLGIEREKVEELIQENGKFGESMDVVIDKMMQEAQAAAYKEFYIETLKQQIAATKNLEDVQGQLTDATKTAEETQKRANEAIEEYNRHASDTRDVMGEYQHAMNVAVEENSRAQATVESLTSAEKDAQAQVQELSKDADYYMKKFADVTNQSMEEAKQSVEENGDAIVDTAENTAEEAVDAVENVDTSATGYYFDKGVADSIRQNAYLVRNAAIDLGRKATGWLNGSLEINSPSRVTMRTGKFFTEGFTEGIKSMFGEAEKTATNLGGLAAGGLNESYVSNNYNRSISAPISVNVSVNGNVDDVDTLARTVAERISDALNRESEVFA